MGKTPHSTDLLLQVAVLRYKKGRNNTEIAHEINILALSLLAGSLFLSSCKKKFDLPTKQDIPVSGYLTIDSIYKKLV